MQIIPDWVHHMTELQTQEHQEDGITDQRCAEKPGRGMEETGQDQRGSATLFLFNFYGKAVGAVKSHFNSGKKTHQTECEDKEYDRLPVNHKVKIEKRVLSL